VVLLGGDAFVPCRIEEKNKKMVVNIAWASYRGGGSNSTDSMRTEFLGTGFSRI